MKQLLVLFYSLIFVLYYPQVASAADTTAAAKPLDSTTIAIDPGHGGYDPGAVWGDIYEKEINLAISPKLAKRLEENGAKVVVTRNGDYSYAVKGLRGRTAKRYDLNQRIKLSEAQQADILITLHVNSTRKHAYEGAEAFYYPKSQQGKKLALAIQQELWTIPGMEKRMPKFSDCYMLRYSKMPAVLVEVGFLSNPHERELLQDPKYRDMLAGSISDGIVNYYQAPEEVMGQGFLQETTSSLYFMRKVLEHAFNFGADSETYDDLV